MSEASPELKASALTPEDMGQVPTERPHTASATTPADLKGKSISFDEVLRVELDAIRQRRERLLPNAKDIGTNTEPSRPLKKAQLFDVGARRSGIPG